jgi:hypothetical protein
VVALADADLMKALLDKNAKLLMTVRPGENDRG